MTTESFTPFVEQPPRLNQPWRLAVAAAEVIVAVVAVLFGIAAWKHGVTTMITPLGAGQPPLRSTIFYGNWMSIGITLVTVAALLGLDAIRECVLALRTRSTRQTPEFTVAPPPAA
ncbi:MAG TPA: hypothetical protein VFX16_17410 [Pseudonocardiaceae bacterium]|nr:hypothetical protein [Pseudonocardiaceae bacterium]